MREDDNTDDGTSFPTAVAAGWMWTIYGAVAGLFFAVLIGFGSFFPDSPAADAVLALCASACVGALVARHGLSVARGSPADVIWPAAVSTLIGGLLTVAYVGTLLTLPRPHAIAVAPYGLFSTPPLAASLLAFAGRDAYRGWKTVRQSAGTDSATRC